MIGQSSCTYQYQEICSHQACQNQIPFNHQIPITYPSSTSLAQPNTCNARRNPTPIGPPRPTFNPTISPPNQTSQTQQQPHTNAAASTYPVSYLVQPPPPQPFNPMEFMRYYSMYNRIPIMPVQPVILHHPGNFQITHLNVATGFGPTPSTTTSASTIQIAPQNSCPNVAFGPPPRDRKHFPNIFDEQSNRSNCSDDVTIESNGHGTDKDETANVSNISEDMISEMAGPVDLKYIENFCIQAERIALKNQHRPCFKNIQHLCNRTRSDIMKPNTTVANIHSQGIPWALKDFIFAFIRLVNATHILHGYVDFKTGSLGKIENHLTTEFKTCYQGWEKLTKDQLIPAITKIILELDNLSNNSANVHPNVHQAGAQPSASNEEFSRSTRVKQLDLVSETVFAAQRNVPGLLRINLGTDAQTGGVLPLIGGGGGGAPGSEEESDSETTTYINPGTHKPLPRTPFQLVNGVQMGDESRDAIVRDDKHWQSAIESIKQMQLLPGMSGDDMKMFAEMETNPMLYSPQMVRASYLQAICRKKEEKPDFLKISLPEKSCVVVKNDGDCLELNGRDVTESCAAGLADEESGSGNDNSGSVSPSGVIQPKMILRQHHADGVAITTHDDTSPKKCIQSRTYRKRLDFDSQQAPQQPFGKASVKRGAAAGSSPWEIRGSGLTEKAIKTFDKIVKDLQGTDFGQRAANEKSLLGKGTERSISIETVSQKLWNHKYSNIRQVVHDIRLIIRNSRLQIEQGKADWIYEKELNAYTKRFNELITDYFRNIDFSDISGNPDDIYYCEMGRKNNRRIISTKQQFEAEN